MTRATPGKRVSPEFLRELLRYDPATGEFRWKRRPREMFSRERMYVQWNRRFADQPALTQQCAKGLYGMILGVRYEAHEVAWAYHYKFWPAGIVKHVGGDVTNNRIGNLVMYTEDKSASTGSITGATYDTAKI